MFQNRTYRDTISREGLIPFTVTVSETDLSVRSNRVIHDEVRNAVLEYRGYIEAHIRKKPAFATTLVPMEEKDPVPEIVRRMLKASKAAGIGPMSAVAGAVAEFAARSVLKNVEGVHEIIVENGGDTFLSVNRPITMGIHAGNSPLSDKIGLHFKNTTAPFSVCTSSGTIGHSLSFGKADGVCVVSSDAATADSAATAICNLVANPKEMETAINFGKSIPGVDGIVIIIHDRIALWGDLEIIPLT